MASEETLTNPVIGIAGFKGVGKTLLAERIAAGLDRRVEIVPFARPVKEIARSMGWNGQKDAKGRRLLQLLGTECGRECIDPDIWVKLWQRTAIRNLHQGTVTIADDMRFKNEAAAVRDGGGLLVRVDRPGFGRLHKWWDLFSRLRARRAHGSERVDLIPDNWFHQIFENDSDLEAVDWFAGHVVNLINTRFPHAVSRH